MNNYADIDVNISFVALGIQTVEDHGNKTKIKSKQNKSTKQEKTRAPFLSVKGKVRETITEGPLKSLLLLL